MKSLSLGGLFEEANSMEELSFRYAVDHINRNKLLPKSRVMAQIERIPSHDSFYASKRGISIFLYLESVGYYFLS